jgi:hypothetical protein
MNSFRPTSLAVLIAFALAACGGDVPSAAGPGQVAFAPAEPATVVSAGGSGHLSPIALLRIAVEGG